MLDDADTRVTSRLAALIDLDWRKAVDNKRPMEHVLLECMRARKGEYSPADERAIKASGQSDIYLRVATGKIRVADSYIQDIVLPADAAAACDIKATSNPTNPPWLVDNIIKRIVENPQFEDAAGNPVDPMAQMEILETMSRRAIHAHSKRAAEKMKRKIMDQLEEGSWRSAMKGFIEQFVTYPAAFLKGPYFAMEPRLTHEFTQTGVKPKQVFEKILKFRIIDVFDAYPAPGASSVQEGSFCERLRMTKADLYAMRELPGYNEAAIIEVMLDDAHGKMHDWLWTDEQRKQVAGHGYSWYESTTDLDGIHWYGRTQGTVLLEWGVDKRLVPDPLATYEVDAIKCGRHVVRASINPDPLYRRQITSAAYERVTGNIFGVSPSMLMDSTTRMINSTARALHANIGHAAGFQMEVNYRRVAQGVSIHDAHPYKVWPTEESEVNVGGSGSPAVRYFQPKSHAPELMNTIQFFTGMAEMQTGISDLMQGAAGSTGGADGTARGRSMLMEAGAKPLRLAISNIDEDVVEPSLRMLYDHNMQHDDDEEIKGDCQMVPTGARSVMQKESARQGYMAAMEITNNPQDRMMIGGKGRANMIRGTLSTFDSLDVDSIIPGGEELDALIARLESQEQPPNPDVLRVQAEQAAAAAKLEQMSLSDAEKYAVEREKIAADERIAEESRRADRVLEAMKLRSQEKISEDRLSEVIQNETIKLRATRMSERERLQMDVRMGKMKAESEIRVKVAEMKRQNEQQAEQGNTVDMPEQLSAADIAAIVQDVVGPMTETFKSELANMEKLLVRETVAQLPAINVTVEAPKPGTKTIRTMPDGDGYSSSVTESGS